MIFATRISPKSYFMPMMSGGGGGGGKPSLLAKKNILELSEFLFKTVGLRKQYLSETVGDERISRFVYSRMNQRGLKSFDSYMSEVRENDAELQKLIKRIVVLETEFFRSSAQFEVLKDFLLGWKSDKKVRIWCAGCATGEEPYSIAMMLKSDERFKRWNINIIATDVVGAFLKVAERGQYKSRAVKKIKDDKYLDIFNSFTLRSEDEFTLSDDIKKLVAFRRHNLMEKFIDEIDVIFCRNVIIYFDLGEITRVVKDFYELLPEGGGLFLGYSESISKFEDPIVNKFVSVNKGDCFYYRKPTPEMEAEKERLHEIVSQARAPRPVAPETPAPLIKVSPPKDDAVKKEISLFVEAKALFDKGEYVRAAELCNKILEDDPDSSEVRYLLGRIFAQRNMFEDSLKQLRAAIGKDRLFTDAHFAEGFVLYSAGDFPAAVRSFENAILLDMNFAMAYFYKAMVHELKGDLTKARLGYKNALNTLKKSEGEIKFSDGFPKEHYISTCESRITEIEKMLRKK
jgi:chemotaxis protein methyltransferase CheR